jgi:hypothetical protein
MLKSQTNRTGFVLVSGWAFLTEKEKRTVSIIYVIEM